MEVTEGSAKIRSAGPSDVEEDYALPIRAGVIPIQTQVGPTHTRLAQSRWF